MEEVVHLPNNLSKTLNNEPTDNNRDEITNEKIEEIADKVLNLAVVPLNVIYLHPFKSRLVIQQLIAIWYTCWVLALYYWSIKYIVLFSVDIAVLTQLISSFGLYTLALLKCVPVVYYNHVIRRLLSCREHFWRARDPELKRVVYEIYAAAHFSGRLFLFLVLLTLAMFLSRPIYDTGAVLTPQWVADGWYYYALGYQVVFALFLVALVLGFNGLFLTTITNMRAQVTILNWSIRNYKNDGSPNDIKALIRFVGHHRFLLKYKKDIEKVFMIQLLALYCLTIASCCMELYAITETPTSLIDKFRSFMYVASLLVQLAMFCFPAGELTSEIMLTADSIYLSNWEVGSRALRTWLPFAIHSTQQVVDFKALGLVTINKMAFIDVAKSTVSFLTLMKNLGS